MPLIITQRNTQFINNHRTKIRTLVGKQCRPSINIMLSNRQSIHTPQRNHRKDIRRLRPHVPIFIRSRPPTIRRNLIKGINLRKRQCPRNSRHQQLLLLQSIDNIWDIINAFRSIRQIRIIIHGCCQRSRYFPNSDHPAIHATMIKIINNQEEILRTITIHNRLAANPPRPRRKIIRRIIIAIKPQYPFSHLCRQRLSAIRRSRLRRRLHFWRDPQHHIYHPIHFKCIQIAIIPRRQRTIRHNDAIIIITIAKPEQPTQTIIQLGALTTPACCAPWINHRRIIKCKRNDPSSIIHEETKTIHSIIRNINTAIHIRIQPNLTSNRADQLRRSIISIRHRNRMNTIYTGIHINIHDIISHRRIHRIPCIGYINWIQLQRSNIRKRFSQDHRKTRSRCRWCWVRRIRKRGLTKLTININNSRQGIAKNRICRSLRYGNHIWIRNPDFLLLHLIMSIFIAKNLHFIGAIHIRAISFAAVIAAAVIAIVQILILLPFQLLRTRNKTAF